MESTQLFETALGLSGGWKAVRSEFSVVQFSDSRGRAIRCELIRCNRENEPQEDAFYQKAARVWPWGFVAGSPFSRGAAVFFIASCPLRRTPCLRRVGSGCYRGLGSVPVRS